MPDFSEYMPQFGEIFQRILYLRKRFKNVFPENMALLRSRIEKARSEDRANGVENLYQYYSVCLVISHHAEPITMGELSREMDIPLSNTTRIVDWLVRNEYASRLPDPEDRRVVRVELTAAGEELFETINEFMMERMARTIRKLTPEEQAQMVHLMNKMLDLIEQDL